MARRKKKFTPKECSSCPHCTYIGEGDFVCDKHIHQPDKALVIDEWTPTDNFLQCLNERRASQ